MNLKCMAITIFSISASFALEANLLDQITYIKSKDTLHAIVSCISKMQKGVYLRFGDGDVNLALGKADMLQRQSKKLSLEMQQAFAMEGPGVLKCLVLNCPGVGLEPGMVGGKFASDRAHATNLMQEASKVWKNIRHVYTPTALHYCATGMQEEAIRFLRFLKASKNKILIGNQNISPHVRSHIFGSDCAFVPTPASNSYNQIDRIEAEALSYLTSNQEYKVAIIAMGCSGRVLQKRLWQKVDNVFLFDFGSLLDALCGWDTRAWISIANFNKDQFLSKLSQDIKVVCTSALIDNQFGLRKQEYIDSLEQLASMWLSPIVIESQAQVPTFLDQYSQRVIYTGTNNFRLKNKGVNEVAAMRAGFKKLDLQDSDMVLKLTGRYFLKNDSFIKLVESNPEYDAFIRYNSDGIAFTGCYAMRASYLKTFLNSIDLSAMEAKMQGVEQLMTDFIKKIKARGAKILAVSNLNLEANIFGEGKTDLTNW